MADHTPENLERAIGVLPVVFFRVLSR
jgi:hypothetical protein